VPLSSHLTSCTATKSNLYLDSNTEEIYVYIYPITKSSNFRNLRFPFMNWIYVQLFSLQYIVASRRNTTESLLTASFVRSSWILSTLITEVICSSETSVLMKITRRHIPEDGFFYSHRCENLKCYITPENSHTSFCSNSYSNNNFFTSNMFPSIPYESYLFPKYISPTQTTTVQCSVSVMKLTSH
jgi:hypothetical protein